MPAKDDAKAIGLYAVGARDFSDFIDMVQEPETTDATLATLRDMLSLRGRPNTDDELNAMLLPIVEREITRRKG